MEVTERNRKTLKGQINELQETIAVAQYRQAIASSLETLNVSGKSTTRPLTVCLLFLVHCSRSEGSAPTDSRHSGGPEGPV